VLHPLLGYINTGAWLSRFGGVSNETEKYARQFRRNKESEKTKHAHMKMEINENATKTNTN
jgi:hypothetical protein